MKTPKDIKTPKNIKIQRTEKWAVFTPPISLFLWKVKMLDEELLECYNVKYN